MAKSIGFARQGNFLTRRPNCDYKPKQIFTTL